MNRTYRPAPIAGEAIKRILRLRNMTVMAFADEIKMSYPYVSQILSGSKNRPKALQKMCEHVGLNYFDYADTKM